MKVPLARLFLVLATAAPGLFASTARPVLGQIPADFRISQRGSVMQQLAGTTIEVH